MKIKPAILSIFSRNELKRLVDDLEIANVDRRSVEGMRTALSLSRKITPDVLLPYMAKGQLVEACQLLGHSGKGRREELIGRLQNNGISNATLVPRRNMSQEVQQGFEFNGRDDQEKPRKKAKKLTLLRLESLLFRACDILRGNMDASEFKEYIFGMLFLKRMSDQFDKDRTTLEAEYQAKGMKPDLIEKQLANPDKYDFFIPDKGHWSTIRHLKESVGSGLNKALAAIEDANPNTLQDVLKGINFNRKVGQRTMDDSTLIQFIQHFDEIPLSNDDFEFPDLLGAAYLYLIKYFADSAGKMGGEFYTPTEVDSVMVLILDPQEGMSVYDPCAGSGGMLIESKQHVQETGGESRNLELAGQDSNGGTWAICKMNMILHGIRSADIRQGDTIKEPQHLDRNGEIRRFDRVIANPPFSQNYSRNGMKFPERFHTFMPESGKKADLMFVQHMVASLKSDGKLAVVMPHGVLFRGGEEKACRQRFIKDGILEAVVGLPAGLFYGTGIPACLLVINRKGASQRKSVLFINADREYKEGKNQNSLRPEDIEKITTVYRSHLTVEKYSREVSYDDLAKEEYNLNIRRYVDNSPPPEPHDVRAHLHGGIPVAEITQLGCFFANYSGVEELLFKHRDDWYSDFSDGVSSKDDIKRIVESAPGVRAKLDAFHTALEDWWKKNVKQIEGLPENQNVFDLRRHCIDSLAKRLGPLNLLGTHQVRGAVASYVKLLESDLKSIAASGWGAELIPEEDILQSQFPEVLEQIEKDQARIAELEGLFAASASADDEEGEVEEGDSETGVLPKALVKTLKDERKVLAGEIKEAKKQVKGKRDDADRMDRTGDSQKDRNHLRADASDIEAEAIDKSERIEAIDNQLARHTTLDNELKQLKANIREVERKKDDMLAAARAKISEEEAKELILGRFKRLLIEGFDGYLRQYERLFVAAVENLWQKYAVTTKQILAERDHEAGQLNQFLKELGYE
ncbi:MAG: N-6 DNA methylase [Planctomycetota bacterium]